MPWTSFSGSQVEALARGASFVVEPRERDCPACGARSVRTYFTAASSTRRRTLVSYVWCAACHRFVGTRTAYPDGLAFTDPLADLSAVERRTVQSSLVGFLAHLDELWESGVLPQSFATRPV